MQCWCPKKSRVTWLLCWFAVDLICCWNFLKTFRNFGRIFNRPPYGYENLGKFWDINCGSAVDFLCWFARKNSRNSTFFGTSTLQMVICTRCNFIYKYVSSICFKYVFKNVFKYVFKYVYLLLVIDGLYFSVLETDWNQHSPRYR